MRICCSCKVEKRLTEFSIDKSMSDGKMKRCRTCNASRARKYYSDNIERCQALGRERYYDNHEENKRKQREYRLKNREDLLEKGAQYRRRLREAVLAGYGRKCATCGESREPIIDLDHVNNDGSKDRQNGLTSWKLYKHVIAEGFPPRFQLLCKNCNWLKHRQKPKLAA